MDFSAFFPLFGREKGIFLGMGGVFSATSETLKSRNSTESDEYGV
jgi:hypothetical protein